MVNFRRVSVSKEKSSSISVFLFFSSFGATAEFFSSRRFSIMNEAIVTDRPFFPLTKRDLYILFFEY